MRAHHYAPTYREMMGHFGLSSPGTIYKHIQVLKRKGLLDNEATGKRSLSPTLQEPQPLHSSELMLPFIGKIIVGSPIETFPQSQSLAVPKHLVRVPDKTYVLQIKGDLLNEELIAEGDLLLVEARQEAQPGDTVVAVINQHDTIVKRYYPEGSHVYLTGWNPQHKPIVVKEEDIRIQGIVVGLIRSFAVASSRAT